MTIIRVLLGSVAIIASNGIVRSADLPGGRAAPADYVRVCDWTGAGFFYIPGTDTCLNINGQLRIEGLFISDSRSLTPTAGPRVVVPARDRDESGFLARARFGVDVRTRTAYGLLRAYVQYQIDRVQGLYSEGGLAGGATTVSNSGGNNATPRRAYIQFAGITAGRVQSFFDFYADWYNYETIANSDVATNVFAYTYNAGGGLSATLSVEDRDQRNLGVQGLGYIFGGEQATAASVRYGGETIPDIVGVLRYDPSWGSAQLSAAFHQIQAESGPFAGTGGQGFSGRDADGYAVQGGFHLKLPMLAAGDDVWVQADYQSGAYLYMDAAYYMNQGYSSALIGGFQHIDRDAIAIHTPGTPAGSYSLQKGTGFSGLIAFNHYLSATFQDVVYASYEQASYGRAGRIDWTKGGLGFAEQYKAGNQLIYNPVKDLQLCLEFDYVKIEQTLAHDVDRTATALPAGVSRNPDAFEARLHLERDF